MKNVLIIAPHPNDETLGVGGTVLKHVEAGDVVHWLILTKPEESKWSKTELSERLKEVDNVGKKYGFKSMRRLNFLQDTLFDVPKSELMDVIRGNFELIKPDTIYLPFDSGFSGDYSAAFAAVMKAIKSFNIKAGKILCYEIISTFDFTLESFKPNVFVDISDSIDKKLEIMNLYELEVQGYPMPKSIESVRSLAKIRGASIGTEYAEAFMLIREVW
ncbi:MAG: PIG-L family deacetylase [Candidatus Gastranaerophilales bacterium]|nr:PIG-L family deacetylase [Candidatus Gastranaerophilales bacterium]